MNSRLGDHPRESELVEELAPAVTPTTVCHTDPHLGNVLAAPDRVWLIDWDDAALSTPEHDLMFVLGGLMLPLELYPSVLQRIARCTPYPSMLNGPASALLGRGGDVLGVALELGLWSGAVVALSAFALKRAARALTLHGG